MKISTLKLKKWLSYCTKHYIVQTPYLHTCEFELYNLLETYNDDNY